MVYKKTLPPKKRLEEFRNKYNLSHLENYDIQQIIKDEKLPYRAAKVLDYAYIRNLKELLEFFIEDRREFLKFLYCGEKTFHEIERVCLKHLKTLAEEQP